MISSSPTTRRRRRSPSAARWRPSPDRATLDTSCCEVAGLKKSFGSIIVADDLDLVVAPGEAVGIIGPNGAGKTTLFNLIAGGSDADCRQHSFRRPRPLEACRRKGAAGPASAAPTRSRSRSRISPCSRTCSSARSMAAANRSMRSRNPAARSSNGSGSSKRANTLAGSLTLLERKRLEMARALATAPRLLLLDEIAGGLTEGECLELVATIRDIRQSGVAILWIEHVVHALLAVIDRLVVLNFGRKIAEGIAERGDATARSASDLYRHRGLTHAAASRPATSRLSTATSRRCTASTRVSRRARPSPSSAPTGQGSRPF